VVGVDFLKHVCGGFYGFNEFSTYCQR
jgi:hypothetical protein